MIHMSNYGSARRRALVTSFMPVVCTGGKVWHMHNFHTPVDCIANRDTGHVTSVCLTGKNYLVN